MSESISILFCSTPNTATAKTIAEQLIQKKAAVCVQVIPQISSIYTWEGKIENAEESLLKIKAKTECIPDIESIIKDQHPYNTPELIAIPTSYVEANYAKWILEN